MQTVLLVFIVLFALAIGFFLGIFLLSLNTPLTRSLTKKDDQEPAGEAPESPVGSLPELKKPTPGSELILKVWQEEGKAPVYDLKGKYLTKEQLPRELLHVITIQEKAPSPAPGQPPAAAPSPPAPEKTPEPEPEEEEEGKLLSVVDEVNDILQKKLIGSPLAGKGIYLMENHNQEIRFWVGLNSYSDVDEIPDPEVRKLIDESVKEWEKNRG